MECDFITFAFTKICVWWLRLLSVSDGHFDMIKFRFLTAQDVVRVCESPGIRDHMNSFCTAHELFSAFLLQANG